MLICFFNSFILCTKSTKNNTSRYKTYYLCFLDYTLLSIQLLLQGVKSLKKGQSFTDPNITKFRSIYSFNRKKYWKVDFLDFITPFNHEGVVSVHINLTWFFGWKYLFFFFTWGYLYSDWKTFTYRCQIGRFLSE